MHGEPAAAPRVLPYASARPVSSGMPAALAIALPWRPPIPIKPVRMAVTTLHDMDRLHPTSLHPMRLCHSPHPPRPAPSPSPRGGVAPDFGSAGPPRAPLAIAIALPWREGWHPP
ncbi:hypothetical protein B0H14DRAFT_3487684 [Mycena olivaceomarginata]|nr:hypothetical protein B0H14DRAFT_3487684 [Mycena olivaceomarginata]